MKMLYISKHKLLLTFLPALALCGMLVFCNAANDTPLSGKIIVVDAGHGGVDTGANRPGVKEKDVNLAIALQVKEVLNNHGAKVILSRDSDIELSGFCDNKRVKGRYRQDLAARLELVEESDADLFISIHANSSSSAKKRGSECFYYAKSECGKALANSIQEVLNAEMPGTSKANPGDYFVLRRNQIPATLIEAGYITNPEERALLQSPEYQRKVAEAIAGGILKYYQDTSSTIHFSLPYKQKLKSD